MLFPLRGLAAVWRASVPVGRPPAQPWPWLLVWWVGALPWIVWSPLQAHPAYGLGDARDLDRRFAWWIDAAVQGGPALLSGAGLLALAWHLAACQRRARRRLEELQGVPA